MVKLIAMLPVFMIAAGFTVSAQTIDTEALKSFAPSTVKETFEVCRYTHLTPQQQVSLAKAIDSENAEFVELVGDDNGVLTVKSRNKLQKMRDKSLAKILDEDQLAQYYRGIYDAEANAEGNSMADRLSKKYNLTDQNWKFIRIAFYKIGLESRVIKKMMADNPKKANAEIARLRDEQLKTIEEKGGIRVDPEMMTVEYIRPFNPNSLRKE